MAAVRRFTHTLVFDVPADTPAHLVDELTAAAESRLTDGTVFDPHNGGEEAHVAATIVTTTCTDEFIDVKPRVAVTDILTTMQAALGVTSDTAKQWGAYRSGAIALLSVVGPDGRLYGLRDHDSTFGPDTNGTITLERDWSLGVYASEQALIDDLPASVRYPIPADLDVLTALLRSLSSTTTR